MPGEQDRPSRDQSSSDPLWPGDRFMQEKRSETNGKDHAELVNGSNPGGETQLESPEIADPGKAGGQS